VNYRNPASPDILLSTPPWENSRTVTPTASAAILSTDSLAQRQTETFSASVPLHNTTPQNLPSRSRSTGDIFHEHEGSNIRARHVDTPTSNNTKDSADLSRGSGVDTVNQPEAVENQKEGKERES
jgi:hypothetical protein